MNEFFVVSYSRSQEAYHVETAGDCIRDGISVWSSGGMTDYIPVGFFETHEKASDYVKILVNSSGIISKL